MSLVYAGECSITKLPKNGWIEYSVGSQKLSPGEITNAYTMVNYKCFPNHIVDGSALNICDQGAWKYPIPDCQPRCRASVITGVSFDATTCYLDDVEVPCTEPAKPNTTAHISCRRRYERESGAKQQIITCGEDGTWNPLPNACSPICGNPIKFSFDALRSAHTFQRNQLLHDINLIVEIFDLRI